MGVPRQPPGLQVVGPVRGGGGPPGVLGQAVGTRRRGARERDQDTVR
uniref:Uncharacterized protein n=1 Tax=Arundo donax TaxID=35708 RepID=A0A0A9GQR7_ARUDO